MKFSGSPVMQLRQRIWYALWEFFAWFADVPIHRLEGWAHDGFFAAGGAYKDEDEDDSDRVNYQLNYLADEDEEDEDE